MAGGDAVHPKPAQTLSGSVLRAAGGSGAAGEHPTEDPSPAEEPSHRMWWVDWCRAQSVWNVVLGHAWWSAVDAVAEVHRANGGDPTESADVPAAGGGAALMIDYCVDIGVFHTVAVFFLLSGFLARPGPSPRTALKFVAR
eukprot:gene10450-9201_t